MGSEQDEAEVLSMLTGISLMFPLVIGQNILT